MSINLNYFEQILEVKHKELLSHSQDRDEILIEHAADEFDRLQQQLNREVAISSLSRTSRLLESVQAALGRIGNGAYGVCLECDEPISEKRLKAIPWAEYCIACQEKADRKHAANETDGDLALAAA